MKTTPSLYTKTIQLRIRDILYALTLILLSCFLFWKCRYGFGCFDEAFRVSVALRFAQGDAVFLHEWHLSQMGAVLAVPFVKIFLAITNDTEGIVLAMRYAYTTFQCFTTLYLYLRLKSIHQFGALLAAISFGLFAPYGLMSLEYNSLGIQFLTLSLVTLVTARSYIPLQYFIAGLCFAAAVLCCPYLVLVYILYLLVILFLYFYCRKTTVSSLLPCWTVKGALYITLGAAVAAIIFAFFVFSRAKMNQLIEVFPIILGSDAEHSASFSEKIESYIRSIVLHQHWSNTNRWVFYLHELYILCLLILFLDRKRKKHKAFHTLFASIATFLLMYTHYKHTQVINVLMYSINYLPFVILLLTDNKMIYRLITLLWLPGYLFSFCLHLSSNQHFFAISSACTISLIGSVLILILYLKELIECSDNALLKAASAVIICMILIFQTASEAHMRYTTVLWDGSMDTLTEKIESGSEAGLYTTPEAKDTYTIQMSGLSLLDTYTDKQVLYFTSSPWYYLEHNFRFSTYSSWPFGLVRSMNDQLDLYFTYNPEKLPDIVYADKEYVQMAQQFAQEHSYTVTFLENGCCLLTK